MDSSKSKLTFLGCNGGIGGNSRQTTCYAIDEKIIIDAGTGLTTIPLKKLLLIDHIILTHAHMDHIACLPLIIDSVCSSRKYPITVWALPEVIKILKKHIFNEKIWPDFTKIPNKKNPFMTFNEITSNGIDLCGFKIYPLPANHGIPACGYLFKKNSKSIAFSGDTTDCNEFWEILKKDKSIKAVIVECSYTSKMIELTNISMHLNVSKIVSNFSLISEKILGIIVHRKPGLENEIKKELKQNITNRELLIPKPGDEYFF